MSNDVRSIALDPSWLQHLEPEFRSDYMIKLRRFLLEEKHRGARIFPPGNLIFNALNSTPLDNVKVVILGQDPYHGPSQAHGLSFSVLRGVPVPPSLQNIYKELESDLGLLPPAHGDLSCWARQGVLLLNAVLTVEAYKAGSHQGQGWEQFTDRVVSVINENKDGVVFMLWGSYAQKKGAVIDRSRHLVLTAPHPSPLSAYRGFLGCRHFSQCNEYLQSKGKKPVDWRVEP
ncbi:MAG: uracil-DNA glycosylase [Clostridia bacterium]|jgi:uracil-DNA glycosylase